jgi:hypothetical protein
LPSTITGLLVLLVSLAPGFTYLLLAERRGRPRRTHSVFRETAQVVLTSVFALVVTLGLFAIAKKAWPSHLPDVQQIVRHPHTYWSNHYVEALLWGTGLLLLACGLAYIWGAHTLGQRLTDKLHRNLVGRLVLPEPETQFVSAWWTILKENEPDSYRYVKCRLTDGSTIEGWLHTFNADVDEVADREIVLTGPIYLTDTDGEVRTNELGAASISARNILVVEVSYHPTNDLDTSENTTPLPE